MGSASAVDASSAAAAAAASPTDAPIQSSSSSSGMKRKGRGGSSTKSKCLDSLKTEDLVEANGNKQKKCAENMGPRKMPKRAAACSNFKEKSVRLDEKKALIQNKQDERVEEEESEAVRLTMLGPESRPCRKILDFILHDADGNPQPFEMSEIDDTYITAIITPMDEDLVKAREKGVKCEGFGRIESWSISGYDEGTPVIWVITDIADYECVKSSSNYKKYFDRFQEKASVCIEVYKVLAKSQGGDPNLSLEELLARVVRVMTGSRSFPSGSAGLEFVISLGEFIFNQLVGLDENPESGDAIFYTLPVLISLKEQCQNRAKIDKHSPTGSSKALRISDEKQAEATEDEDEKLARLLQEEEEWKVIKQRARQSSTLNKFYIKITEDEIANDYPLPAYYKPAVQEMDEYIFFDSDDAVCYSDALPTRILDNWSFYNSDSRLISLELLPMKPCAEVDVTIFGSGYMREDDGTGFCLDVDLCQSSSSSGAVTEGVPVYLSAIKEWMVEFGSSMVFISIRTEMAWYRLGKPAKQYSPWYEPILKTARLAISIISLLKEQSRASKLSFSDAIKRVAEFGKNHPAYTSSNIAAVERYVVVHGQIILQQFAEYPDEVIRRCAFVTGLAEKMELRHHTKLLLRKKVAIQKGINMNPSASMEPIQSRRKVMRATTTRLINRIWGDYYSHDMPEDSKEGFNLESKEEEEIEEQDENEDEEADLEEEKVLCDEENPKPHPITRSQRSKADGNGIEWQGVSSGKTGTGESIYRSARVHGNTILIGGAVIVDSNELDGDIVYIEYLFEKSNGAKMFHGTMMKKGSQTVLGNAANEMELFLTNECSDFELADVKESVVVDIRSISWGHKYQKEHANRYKIDKAKAEERKKKGLPIEYFCKSLYWPQRGAFLALPFDTMGLGTGSCHSCKLRESNDQEFRVDFTKSSFTYKNIKYCINDVVYVRPDHFGEVIVDGEKFKAGRNVGLKAYAVCQVLELETTKRSGEPTPANVMIKARRFYRPEDISSEKAYRSDIRELYYSEDISSIPVEMIEGKCAVRKKNQISDADFPICSHIFFCEHSYDPNKGSFKQHPTNFKIKSSADITVNGNMSKKNKGKCKEGEKDDFLKWKNIPLENRLATLDIFAGCGGLSEGLQQSGVSFTKWAIEYEQPAGEAFSQNHPDAVMFIDNCNVILRAIMEKCGDTDDCISTAEAKELAAALDEEKLKNLPLPGQVDFINGGPPCQGFSGMNRFSHGMWSKVQCEMILAFLSYADYFRPRFFLLENVRTFVSFNKGQTFRLTLASLLEMGYQVRFGILEAGAYGVSQSRKRAFIWAASPEETLPEWPEPMHVFASPELKVSLPGDIQYAAVRSTAGGAPFRSITVRDTIGDLPPVANGASKLEVEYGVEPVSWFQKQIRGNMMVVNDHISKEMNELNLIRCQHIPKHPGADWRDLPEKKVKLSTGQMVDLIPWCLPNTAKRHNQWKGLFGRLDWEGNFPTSITDPQPMGKVGMCFHPDQDRILSVRECSRSQGFPDSYGYSGNIQNKHRQIGNAVPPPLAYALGMKLKEVIDTKEHTSR